MPKLITVTDMIRSFSDIVGRVYYNGETFDIKKGANIDLDKSIRLAKQNKHIEMITFLETYLQEGL